MLWRIAIAVLGIARKTGTPAGSIDSSISAIADTPVITDTNTCAFSHVNISIDNDSSNFFYLERFHRQDDHLAFTRPDCIVIVVERDRGIHVPAGPSEEWLYISSG